MLRIKWFAAALVAVAAVVIAALLGGGAATPAARAGALTQGLSAYIVATNKGPLPPCSEDGSNCTNTNTVRYYIHIVNANGVSNTGAFTRANVANAFVVNSIDDAVFVNGVQDHGFDFTYTPPPNPSYQPYSGHWLVSATCPAAGPPCNDISNPAVLPQEDTSVFYTGWSHGAAEPNGTYIFKFTIHGTLNGNPIDLITSSPPIQMNGTSTVVVPSGQPVQIAFVGSSDFADLTQSFRNGIQMAIEQHPTIRGFPIQINQSDPSCGDASANVAAADAIVSNFQNTAVIGHACSSGFTPALPIYENADVVTISGSATDASLPSLGPHVFNRTAVADPNFDPWYALVTALPSDLAFQQNYQNEFGAPPGDFTDLYFDATTLLLSDLQKVSKTVNGSLVIDRQALAQAIRNTTNYPGVTCTITLNPATGNRLDDPASLARCTEQLTEMNR